MSDRTEDRETRDIANLNEFDEVPAGIVELEKRATANLTELSQRMMSEGDRRTTPMSFAIRGDLKERLTRVRGEGTAINVSSICNDAIERELDRIESGNALVQRLRIELTERRGFAWTMGFQAGRKWAEDTATWLEITEFATVYTGRDVKVVMYNEDSEHMYVGFTGRFRAPERDYDRDMPEKAAAPSFKYVNDEGEFRWEYRLYELESYWRAWLTAVRDVYDQVKADMPSVIDQLAPEPPRDVDPDEIPF
jgi:hypothetical protein